MVLLRPYLPSLANHDSYDYFSQSLEFIIRMPSHLHEAFCARVVRNICNQLDNIAALHGSAAAYARNVEPEGSPTLKFPSDKAVEDGENNRNGKGVGKYDTHDPDATFYYSDMCWPCVIIEVSYSQKRKALKDLAENYILGSDGNTSVVIGLDIEYKPSKQATLSVWRPQFRVRPDGQRCLFAAQTVVDQVRFLFISLML